MRYTYLSDYLQKEQKEIETLVLGSSQTKTAINPQWLSSPTLNLASTSQHHDTDFKLYTGLKERLPKLKTVIIEVSYSHFELPHNGADFWKNSIYLEYFEANCFERRAWLKDRFIYLANPPFFSDALYDEYLGPKRETNFNEFGFDLNQFEGVFSRNNYDEETISEMKFTGNSRENEALFRRNSAYLIEMLKAFDSHGIDVILITTPLYKNYLDRRNAKISKRRDSMLTVIGERFPNLRLLDLEEDTANNFTTKDFLNQNHLNPEGAKKFTARLEQMLKERP
ncbi:MAG: hypothetical protein KJO05_10630 [Bacteroidia bacterium]|nr:hypothetical protein [Bacteroidia bacterium]